LHPVTNFHGRRESIGDDHLGTRAEAYEPDSFPLLYGIANQWGADNPSGQNSGNLGGANEAVRRLDCEVLTLVFGSCPFFPGE
jgi:hypothetical protein